MNTDNRSKLIKIYIEDAKLQLKKLRHSYRWKVGNTIIRWVECLLMRERPRLGIDILEEHLQAIDQIINQQSLPEDGTESRYISYGVPLKIALVVSDPDIVTSTFGDTFVANDFGQALSKLGHEVNLIKSDKSTNVSSYDVVVHMLWNSQVDGADFTNQIHIGWIRNYPERWTKHAMFNRFSVVLCSSTRIKDYIDSLALCPVYLFPIATNTDRYYKQNQSDLSNSVLFVGNKFAEERSVEQLMITNPGLVKIFGSGWGREEQAITNSELPKLYNQYKFHLDSANASTKKWGSLNSRVFDVLASGRLILTDCTHGADLLYADLPTYTGPDGLTQQVDHFRLDSKDYSSTVDLLNDEILAKHTFTHRAELFSLLLGKKLRISIKIAASEKNKLQFGDYYFANDLADAFGRLGHEVLVDTQEEWYRPDAYQDDLVIVLRGLKPYKKIEGQFTILWVISHPDLITDEELKAYDHICTASDTFPQRGPLESQITTLYQCSCPQRFWLKERPSTYMANTLLFIGNSRGVYRKSVKYAIELGYNIDIIGRGWEGFVPKSLIKADFVSNEELAELYATYPVVLNDHWEDMLNHGILSNRVFDASMAGATVLSDYHPSFEKRVSGVHYYTDKTSFNTQVDTLLSSQPSKRHMGKYQAVNHHTFDHRVSSLLHLYYKATR